MRGEKTEPHFSSEDEPMMAPWLTLSGYIDNMRQLFDQAGLSTPEEFFQAMSGSETITYAIENPQPENHVVVIDTILENDARLAHKLKWLYLQRHRGLTDFFAEMNPDLSERWCALTDRFAEASRQTHLHGPVFVDDHGPNLRWRDERIPMRLESDDVQKLASAPSKISVLINGPQMDAIDYLMTGNVDLVESKLPSGIKLECVIESQDDQR